MKRNDILGIVGSSLLGLALGASVGSCRKSYSRPVEDVSEIVKIAQVEKVSPLENLSRKDDLQQRLEVFAKYTGNFEGRRNRVYDPNPNDEKPEPTIGIGHYMDRGDSREVFARALPEVDYDSVYNGRASLTDKQIDKLFAIDIVKYFGRAKRLVPEFDKLPLNVQKVIVDKAYRGDLGSSPKALRLFNLGKIGEAADEFLNRKDYRIAGETGMTGVRRRLEDHDRILRNYANSKR